MEGTCSLAGGIHRDWEGDPWDLGTPVLSWMTSQEEDSRTWEWQVQGPGVREVPSVMKAQPRGRCCCRGVNEGNAGGKEQTL